MSWSTSVTGTDLLGEAQIVALLLTTWFVVLKYPYESCAPVSCHATVWNRVNHWPLWNIVIFGAVGCPRFGDRRTNSYPQIFLIRNCHHETTWFHFITKLQSFWAQSMSMLLVPYLEQLRWDFIKLHWNGLIFLKCSNIISAPLIFCRVRQLLSELWKLLSAQRKPHQFLLVLSAHRSLKKLILFYTKCISK